MLNQAAVGTTKGVNRQAGLPGAAVVDGGAAGSAQGAERGIARRVLAGVDTAITLRRGAEGTRIHAPHPSDARGGASRLATDAALALGFFVLGCASVGSIIALSLQS